MIRRQISQLKFNDQFPKNNYNLINLSKVAPPDYLLDNYCVSTYLCAWVDGWSYAEAPRPVEEHAVQEVALARAVHAGHGDHTDWALEGSQDVLDLLVNFEF